MFGVVSCFNVIFHIQWIFHEDKTGRIWLVFEARQQGNREDQDHVYQTWISELWGTTKVSTRKAGYKNVFRKTGKKQLWWLMRTGREKHWWSVELVLSLNMSLKITLLCSLIITLITRILDTFMFWLNMFLKMALLCSLIFTLITRILDTFMLRLNMCLKMPLSCK